MIDDYGIVVRSIYSSHEDTIKLACATTVAVGMLVKYNVTNDNVEQSEAVADLVLGLVVEVNNGTATILRKFTAEVPLLGNNSASNFAALGFLSYTDSKYKFQPNSATSATGATYVLVGRPMTDSAATTASGYPVYFDFVQYGDNTVAGA